MKHETAPIAARKQNAADRIARRAILAAVHRIFTQWRISYIVFTFSL